MGQPSTGTVPDDTPEAVRVKASLRRLARRDGAAIIERAAEATDDIGAAARFAGTVGTDQLAAAVEATDDPALERRGRRALEAFRQFRRAAAGDYRDGGDCQSDGGDCRDDDGDCRDDGRDGADDPDRVSDGGRRDDHFHRGHGTDLRGDGESPSR